VPLGPTYFLPLGYFELTHLCSVTIYKADFPGKQCILNRGRGISVPFHQRTFEYNYLKTILDAKFPSMYLKITPDELLSSKSVLH
jgi:hypothetical protein